MHSPCSLREREREREITKRKLLYYETKSENQWNKNGVAQFTEQINQKTNPTRKM
jgi:hypothetical protein